MDDSRVNPVAPVDAEPVDAVDPPLRRLPVAGDVPRADAAPAAGADVRVAAQVTRAQLERPIGAPASTAVVADVHDAAQHGNAVAEAIERAHTADPHDRAQQLGGAAASAASGQATPPDEPAASDEDDLEPRVDPLAPIDATTRTHARDPREEQGWAGE